MRSYEMALSKMNPTATDRREVSLWRPGVFPESLPSPGAKASRMRMHVVLRLTQKTAAGPLTWTHATSRALEEPTHTNFLHNACAERLCLHV